MTNGIPVDPDRLKRPHVDGVSCRFDGDKVIATIHVADARGVRVGTLPMTEWVAAGSWQAARKLLEDFAL